VRNPVLILLDRTMDMATALHHPWTYQALVHDVLDLRLNRVTLEVGRARRGWWGKVHGVFADLSWRGSWPLVGRQVPDGNGVKRKEYDLDVKDAFWRNNAGTIFPEVARTPRARPCVHSARAHGLSSFNRVYRHVRLNASRARGGRAGQVQGGARPRHAHHVAAERGRPGRVRLRPWWCSRACWPII